MFDYPDGRFMIRYEGRELPYSVFDRLSQIRQADIVNNKRLAPAQPTASVRTINPMLNVWWQPIWPVSAPR